MLSSTQDVSIVDPARAAAQGVSVLRRRSGGGAVFLAPGEQIWADLWVPRDDPLWCSDVARSAATVGEWWLRAIADVATGLSLHRGAMHRPPGAEQVCFASRGPGEVLSGGRKLVGLAQWRSREGILVQGCCYRRWDPNAVPDLLRLTPDARADLVRDLSGVATGLESVGAGSLSHETLVAALPGGPAWETLLV